MTRKRMDRIIRESDLRLVWGVGDFCGRDFSKKVKADGSFVGHWLGGIYARDIPNAPRIKREVIASLKPALQGDPGGLEGLVDKINQVAPQRGKLVVEPRVGQYPDGEREVVRRGFTEGKSFRQLIFWVIGWLLEREMLFPWLGVCKNENCGKIFVRNRAGRAKVCSAPCGVSFQNRERLEQGYFRDLRKSKRERKKRRRAFHRE